MNDKARIMVVDDDSIIRDVLENALSDHYSVTTAADGTDALMLAQTVRPNLIILDVEMHGMDGYELCRRLKAAEITADTPVIFVSARSQIDERLKGYEAGGEDYIIKPVEYDELRAKVAQRLKAISERTSLKEMANYATSTAMTAMTSLSEMGALFESLKRFNASIDERSLADAVLDGLSHYGLDGVVQIRTTGLTLSLSAQGEATPLEIAVINHMTGMDRIIQFKNRLSIHYPHVAIMVKNMPVEDADRCGRLRDHLAMLVESAEMKADGIIAENESKRRGEAIERAAVSITKMLAEVDAAQRQSKLLTTLAVNDFTGEMEKAYIRVALSDSHERFMADVVHAGVE